jgi:hypothetical protein
MTKSHRSIDLNGIRYVYDDGGRKAAGFKGKVDDCVCRAIAIATEQPYRVVYNAMSAFGWFPEGEGKRGGPSRLHPHDEN